MIKPTGALKERVKIGLIKLSEIVDTYAKAFAHANEQGYVEDHQLMHIIKSEVNSKEEELTKAKCDCDVLAVLIKPNKENIASAESVELVYNIFLEAYNQILSQSFGHNNLPKEVDEIKTKLNNALFILEDITIQ